MPGALKDSAISTSNVSIANQLSQKDLPLLACARPGSQFKQIEKPVLFANVPAAAQFSDMSRHQQAHSSTYAGS